MRYLLFCLLLVCSPAVLSPQISPKTYAQALPTRAQKNAIEQWARVVRKGQTAPVMWQVAQLIDEVTDEVKAKNTKFQYSIFISALGIMKRAATSKAQGIEEENKVKKSVLLQAAEANVQASLKLIYGRA